jgi:Na+-translocating ferredoxin:NAD+ oxidoreductase RnfD subunit
MTTPETPVGRVLFGAAIAILDSVLRFYQVSYAPFFALFVMAGFLPFFREAFKPEEPERVWQPVARPI